MFHAPSFGDDDFDESAAGATLMQPSVGGGGGDGGGQCYQHSTSDVGHLRSKIGRHVVVRSDMNHFGSEMMGRLVPDMGHDGGMMLDEERLRHVDASPRLNRSGGGFGLRSSSFDLITSTFDDIAPVQPKFPPQLLYIPDIQESNSVFSTSSRCDDVTSRSHDGCDVELVTGSVSPSVANRVSPGTASRVSPGAANRVSPTAAATMKCSVDRGPTMSMKVEQSPLSTSHCTTRFDGSPLLDGIPDSCSSEDSLGTLNRQVRLQIVLPFERVQSIIAISSFIVRVIL